VIEALVLLSLGLFGWKQSQSDDSGAGAAGGGGGAGPSYPLVTEDPGVDTAHVPGTFPCPSNPAPPAGWAYWTGPVSAAMTQFAVGVLTHYPIGSIVQDIVEGAVAMARVEWHTARGATGETGICIHGVSLFKLQS